jgi:hypothetical protein
MAFNKTQGNQLATLIRQWMVNSKQGAPEGELLNFVNDLENANNVGIWAGVNYERIIPFRAALPKIVRWMSILRNALVFFPVVVTWVALEQASSTWNPPETDANFLKHWQTMDGLFTLRNVAWFDAAIIALLVALTIITGVLEESNKGRLALEREHQNLMIALERDLSGYRYLSIQDINNAAQDTLTTLQKSTQLVEAAAQMFLNSSTQAHDAIVGANDVVHKTFAPAVQRLDDTINALSNAAVVHKDMVLVVQTVQSDFAAQMATLKQGVTTVLSAIDSQMNNVMQNMDGQISTAAASLGAASKSAMEDVTRVAHEVATSASRQIGQQMQSFSSSFDQAVRDLGGLANSLNTTITALNSTSNNVMVNTATLADDLGEIHEVLQQTISRLRG